MFQRLLFLLLLIPIITPAQSYTKDEIKQRADSIMHSYLGNDMYQACKLTKKCYYCYTDDAGTKHWQMLNKSKWTEGNLVYATMVYKLNYTYPKCDVYNDISGKIYLELDNNLKSKGRPDMGFIPDFVFKHENCNLLTLPEAMVLAHKKLFKDSKKEPKATIYYDKSMKQFFWLITNKIKRDSTIQKKYIMQTIKINANTRIAQNPTLWLPGPTVSH
ncbi:MAG TPA: hypothetical protein VN721_02085 [Flavipsychrobacter sp.]|nr:hypothetical protein [Flavipsychrobacter sp.]